MKKLILGLCLLTSVAAIAGACRPTGEKVASKTGPGRRGSGAGQLRTAVLWHVCSLGPARASLQ